MKYSELEPGDMLVNKSNWLVIVSIRVDDSKVVFNTLSRGKFSTFTFGLDVVVGDWAKIVR